MLNMMIEQVAARFDERFTGDGAVDMRAVAEQRGQKAEARHHGCRDPHILPDVLQAAKEACHGGNGGNTDGLVADE